VMGCYTAFGKYYRFAAADAAEPDFKARAISLTLAGGIAGGILAPEMAKRTTGLVDTHPYLATYISLMAVCAVAMLILTRLDIPKLSEHDRKDSGRPLSAIMTQPVFLVASLASALSYGIMNLFMTSTPLAMRAHDHHFNDAAFVLQWHVIGMYAPSFFTGSLINRFGVLNIILAGIGILFLCIVAALAGESVFYFWMSLSLLGIGWNFMYVGGSAREDPGSQRFHGFLHHDHIVHVFGHTADAGGLACRELRLHPVPRSGGTRHALAHVAAARRRPDGLAAENRR
jgi:predicted MFS family arabinose efflux permease